jgi:hypothetical protein
MPPRNPLSDASRLALLEARVLGVRTLTIEYSGSGDSGSINDIAFDGGSYTPQSDVDAPGQPRLYTRLEQAAYEVLGPLPFDWQNNDGGSGTLTIDIVAGTWVCNHTEYERVYAAQDEDDQDAAMDDEGEELEHAHDPYDGTVGPLRPADLLQSEDGEVRRRMITLLPTLTADGTAASMIPTDEAASTTAATPRRRRR